MRFWGFNFWIKWRIIHVWPSSFLSFCLSFRVLSPPRARGFLEARGSCQLRGGADTAGGVRGGATPRPGRDAPFLRTPPPKVWKVVGGGSEPISRCSPTLPFSLDFLLLSSSTVPWLKFREGRSVRGGPVLSAPQGRGFREAGARAGAAGRRRAA